MLEAGYGKVLFQHLSLPLAPKVKATKLTKLFQDARAVSLLCNLGALTPGLSFKKASLQKAILAISCKGSPTKQSRTTATANTLLLHSFLKAASDAKQTWPTELIQAWNEAIYIWLGFFIIVL
jgi:hypothetical protein